MDAQQLATQMERRIEKRIKEILLWHITIDRSTSLRFLSPRRQRLIETSQQNHKESLHQAPAPVFFPDWVKYKGQVAQWLKEIPAPVDDQRVVEFVRVNKSLTAQGSRLLRGSVKNYLTALIPRYTYKSFATGVAVVWKP